MAGAANPLLRLGATAAWARIEAEQRAALSRPQDTSNSGSRAGSALSAQAAMLRRSVRDDASLRARP